MQLVNSMLVKERSRQVELHSEPVKNHGTGSEGGWLIAEPDADAML
jgi:hypothetical protein